jgi:hypothetical protein
MNYIVSYITNDRVVVLNHVVTTEEADELRSLPEIAIVLSIIPYPVR